MEVKFSVYFTDHTGIKKRIDEKIIDIEEGNWSIEVGKLYQSFTFVANNLYIHPSIVGDLIERVEVKYQIDDGEAKSEKFVIDSVDLLPNQNVRVYTKTIGVKYSEKYSGLRSETIPATSFKDLIGKMIDLPVDMNKMTDIPLSFDWNIDNKSIEESFNELSSITGFEFYWWEGTLHIEDKKRIEEDDTPIYQFDQIKNILEFNTSSNKEDPKISKLYINTTAIENIEAEPTITLEINDSPQCCSPDNVLIFQDNDGNTYKMRPVNAFWVCYFSPTSTLPQCNLPYEEGERIVIENYSLSPGDDYVKLAGGIDEIIAIEGVENHSFIQGVNLLTFTPVEEETELKVTYKTRVLYGVINHSKYPKSVPFEVKHFNQIIKYTHQIELNGFYPVPYDLTINLMRDWGVDYVNAINKTIQVAKKEGDVWVVKGQIVSNPFGEAVLSIPEYGTYQLTMEGEEPLYIDWYINKKSIYMDEVVK
ncbi:MAG: hypothetical protein C6I01_01890 [Epsilonproteobacteria bacterium]|nr:hypothetical protein [Campylobacterota bacterium]